jgi:hypothetical protein
MSSAAALNRWLPPSLTASQPPAPTLNDYIAELKEALQDAEERLKDLEK